MKPLLPVIYAGSSGLKLLKNFSSVLSDRYKVRGTAPEVLRGGGDELPDFCKFFVPGCQGRIEGVDDEVVDVGSPPSLHICIEIYA